MEDRRRFVGGISEKSGHHESGPLVGMKILQCAEDEVAILDAIERIRFR
jgi:hypothetical protein